MSVSSALQTILIPGLLCSPRLYEPVLPTLWTFGATTVADTRRDDRLAKIAQRLLASVPGPFALVGLSMGGYIALEVVRQAPERVLALALLSTSARPDTPEQAATRREQVAIVQAGRFDELIEAAFPLIVDAGNAHNDASSEDVRADGHDRVLAPHRAKCLSPRTGLARNVRLTSEVAERGGLLVG